jgi:hypothetical protein
MTIMQVLLAGKKLPLTISTLTSSGTNVNSTSISTGTISIPQTANNLRYVLVGLSFYGNTPNVSNITITPDVGTPVTLNLIKSHVYGGAVVQAIKYYGGYVPTGTTIDIGVTFTDASMTTQWVVYCLENLVDTTAYSVSDTTNTNLPLTRQGNCLPDGVIFGGCNIRNATSRTFSWTNLTSINSYNGDTICSSFAYKQFTSQQTNLSITCDTNTAKSGESMLGLFSFKS